MNKKRTLLKATILPLMSLPLILTPVILTSCGNGQGGGQPTPYKKSFDASILGAQHGTFELEITGTAAKFISFSEDISFADTLTSFNFNDGYISDPETGKRFTITELSGQTFFNHCFKDWNKVDLVIPGCIQKIDEGFGHPKEGWLPLDYCWKSVTFNEGVKSIAKNARIECNHGNDWHIWENLTLNLPSTLEFVGENAFGNYHDIFINKKDNIISDKPIFTSEWYISPQETKYGTVHVPQSLLNVYQNNWNWKTQLWDKGVTLVGDIQ